MASKVKRKKNWRNKFEKKVYGQIRRSKLPFKYEQERVPYVLACHYLPDFRIEVPNGILYVETKGYLRPGDRRKLAAVKRQNPKLDIRIVFYRASKTNIAWANRIGFKWAIGEIPKEWLQGL